MYPYPILLLVVFALLQILDWNLTRRLLVANVAHEANRITAYFIKRAGIDAGILVPKAVVVALAIIFLRDHLWILCGLCAAYIGVVIWNYVLVRSKLD